MHSRADSNVNGQLELQELSAWISIKTKEHLTLALRENFFMFTAIDQNPRNGKELYTKRTHILYMYTYLHDFRCVPHTIDDIYEHLLTRFSCQM